MSNRTLTLLDCIDRHPDKVLVISEKGEMTGITLAKNAFQFREANRQLAKARVAILAENPIDIMLSLIALDGYAHRILLLPPDLDAAFHDEILDNFNISHVLENGTVSKTAGEQHEFGGGENTEWLFTTSGTSDTPRVFSHSLATLSSSIKPGKNTTAELRWGLAYQAYRFAGVQVILQALLSGSTLVVPGYQDIAAQADQFVAHRVNALSATPSQWRSYLIHGSIRACPLKQITLGGEIADQAILSALRRQYPGARISHIYASTEAGVGFSVTDGQAGFPTEWLDRQFPCAMRISGHGTLLIKSLAVSSSDSLQPRLSEDGFLDTEDCVEIIEDRVFFLGRASGAINVGGNKVHPEEIENLVRSLPGVRNATVSGKKNPIMGELVSLKVQSEDPSSEERLALKTLILKHCQTHLPKYKVPALITFVDRIDVGDSGKIDRKNLP